jgi:hypothetical protein
MTPAAHDLYGYIAKLARLQQSHGLRVHGYAYDSPEAFVLRHGRWYMPQPLPLTIHRGAPKACYGNAIVAAVRDDLIYVEGYASLDIGGGAFPFQHAWCTDTSGALYEVTWPTPGTAYLGVEFSVERADDCTWHGDATVLWDWQRQYPLLREPWQGEPILKRWPPSPRLALLHRMRVSGS